MQFKKSDTGGLLWVKLNNFNGVVEDSHPPWWCKDTGFILSRSAVTPVFTSVSTVYTFSFQLHSLQCNAHHWWFHLTYFSFSFFSYGIGCQTSASSGDHLVLPAYSTSDKSCLFQSDPLLFSCARSHRSWIRICPCRDYIKDQIALCKDCL